jgi:phospholipase A-2-activating protein
MQLHGHQSIVFTLARLPSYPQDAPLRLVSGSDDFFARVWNGAECGQTLHHPASIWSVCVLPLSGDIVVGCSDKIIRVWTRHTESMVRS